MHPAVVCPACRDHGPHPGFAVAPGALTCTRCRATFPVTVAPLLAQPLAPFVAALADSHPTPPVEARALVPFLPDDAPAARRLQRASVAALAHWGDRLSPARDAAWRVFEPFLASLPDGDVLELGCGAGRIALELATPGRRVVALDTDPTVLAIATSVHTTGQADVLVRTIGAAYEPARLTAPQLRGRPVDFVLADALNPPLAAGAFDAVVALNLLDNVRVPSTLVGQIDALLKPGGMLLLSTPYAWDSAQVDDGERIGGAPGRPFGGRPEDELRRLLTGESLEVPWKFEILRDEPHVPWTLQRDDRCRFLYDLHVVLARKPREP